MQATADYICAFCGETNTTFVDFSGSWQQAYVEDCQVCCQPNLLAIAIDPETGSVAIASEPES